MHRQLAPVVKDLLGCMDVWCDSRSEESSQSFVLWAGSLLQNRQASVWTYLFGNHVMVAQCIDSRAGEMDTFCGLR